MEWLKEETPNFVYGSPCNFLALGLETVLEWAWSRPRDVLNFLGNKQ